MDKKNLLASILRLKLEALDLAGELLPQPIKTKTAKCQRELIQILHQVTGEYLAEEKAEAGDTGALKKVEIQ